MAWGLLDDDGIVVAKDIHKREGFVKIPDHVSCGMKENQPGEWVSAEKHKIEIDNEQIKEQFHQIDLRSIRALRTNDTKRLQDLEKDAEKLREKIK